MKKDCCTCPDVCSIHDVKKLDELLYGLNVRLSELSYKKVQNLFYGYYKGFDLDTEINKITVLRKAILRHKLGYYISEGSCICSDNLQRIIEKVIKEIGKASCPSVRKDVQIDDSGLEAYLMTKPACVSYDTWNKFARGLCGEIGFTLTAEKEICDITFDISTEVIPCNLLYTLSIYKEMCDLGYKVNRTDDECKIDFDILAERHCNLNLSFKDFKTLVKDCNMSLNTIDQCYKSNLQLIVLNRKAYLKTSTNTYPVEAISPSNLDRLVGLGFSVTIDDIISNEYQ